MNKKVLKILTAVTNALFHVSALGFGFMTIASMILRDNSEAITPYLNQKSYIVVESDDGEDIDTQYYPSDKKSVKEIKENTGKQIQNIAEEGSVLLKNENDALPLSQGTTISFFSTSSVDPVYAGNGSSGANISGVIDLKEGVMQSGLNVNEDLWNWYVANKSKYTRGEAGNTFGKTYPINDASYDEITTSSKSNKDKTKGGAAVFVLARNGGEGADLAFAEGGEDGDYSNGNYLELSPNEKSVLKNLKLLKEAGIYSSIVVLINSAYAIQCDFADDPDYGIDSILWIGNYGTTGAYAIGNILSGKTNPSGRLSDTFWKYNRLNPVLANFGTYDYDEKISPSNIAKGNTDKYVVYQEGIYNGYRYAETRYEDYVLDRINTGTFDYDDTISYPFGYGISYTDFSYSDFQVTYSERMDEYTCSLKVKNIGNKEGKEVVQIYLQKPYTDHDIENGIEKSSVELVSFGKTKTLNPNEEETLEITVDGEMLASYDAYHARTYILDEGAYYLTAARDSHDAINNILELKASQTQKAKMTASGNKGLVYQRKVSFDDQKYSKSNVTGKVIQNQFDNADLNLYDGRGNNSVIYLSRNNWMNTVSYGVAENGNKTHQQVQIKATDKMKEDVEIQLPTPDDIQYPTYGSTATNYGIVDMRLDEIPYDDAMWEDLLDQLTWDETVSLLSSGCRKTVAIGSVAKPETIDHNGATGPIKQYNYNEAMNHGLAVTNDDPDKKTTPNIYPCNGLVASTFNKELSEVFGKAMGEDCLWAGYNGLYGTGINLHRSPYGGRSFEYYSEDPILTGYISAYEVKGIQSYGVYCYMKHCVLNDMEENREGLCVWANEQTIRELYLKPFELAIKIGNAYNVMTGFNRLGLKWNGEQGFVNNVLRDEFGMKGFAVTDWFDERTWYMTSFNAILNGNDLPDGQYKKDSLNDLNNYKTGYGELAWSMRKSAHHILYTVSHSNAMNGYKTGMRVIPITPKWIKQLNQYETAIRILFIVVSCLWIGMHGLRIGRLKNGALEIMCTLCQGHIEKKVHNN